VTVLGRRIVLSYGCFDQFGPRDADFLRQATALGDELIVGCASDAFARSRGLPCVTTFDHRKELLEHCRFVDRVIRLDDGFQIRTDIVNYNASILVVGPEGYAPAENLHDIAQIFDMAPTQTPQMQFNRAI
jgi:cytidyltransferase-like protein